MSAMQNLSIESLLALLDDRKQPSLTWVRDGYRTDGLKPEPLAAEAARRLRQVDGQLAEAMKLLAELNAQDELPEWARKRLGEIGT